MTSETFEMKQENKLGSQSTQIALQNNYYGMDYQNTKSLCQDLIRNELEKYKSDAEQLAKERDEKFLSTLFEKLHRENIDDNSMCKEFRNPDMQYTFVEAQKAFIRLGTPELETILSNLLVDRAKESNRTLLQIALAEAVSVVPMLLPSQLDILALCFRLRYTRNNIINNLPTFFNYIQEQILPHVPNAIDKISSFQHLVYTKTASIDLGEISLENIFIETYGGLFLSGYIPEELNNFPKKYPDLFIQCIQDPSKIQINSISREALDEQLSSINNMPDEDKRFIQEHFSNNLMSQNAIKDFICSNIPSSKMLFSQWNDTSLKHLTLTSVGIVLGANRCKQISGTTFDMNIWI